jgi:hypothetical protein
MNLWLNMKSIVNHGEKLLEKKEDFDIYYINFFITIKNGKIRRT